MTAAYTRLTRKKGSLLGFSQAWLAKDHLLIVNSLGFVERYQRFALADIQSIVVSERPRVSIWSVLAGVASLAWMSLAFRTSTPFSQGFFVITGLIGLVLVIVDLARGPRCRCIVQTAVSREILRPVSRVRTARKVLRQVGAAIDEIQGCKEVGELAVEEASVAPWAVSPSLDESPPEIGKSLNFAGEVLFGLLLADSLLMRVALHSTVSAAFGLLPVVYMAEFVLGTVAIFYSRSRDWFSLLLIAAAAVAIVADPIFLSVPAVWPSLVSSFKQAGTGQPVAVPSPFGARIVVQQSTILFSVGWRAAIALVGLGACFFERRTAAR